jgi:hypothetical protein
LERHRFHLILSCKSRDITCLPSLNLLARSELTIRTR